MNELQVIQTKVFDIRSQRVMLDVHLAEMYGIETRVLKQAVRRNIDRFPPDFMFKLSKDEAKSLMFMGVSQSVIPHDYNFSNTLPFAFTEQGIAMLSSVLKSPKAIQINISVMRAFVELRKYALGYAELRNRIDNLETNIHYQIGDIYTALAQKEDKKDRPVVGYIQPKK